MNALLELAAKFAGLVFDAINTAIRAAREKLTDEQIKVEVNRIKAKAAEIKADDWDTVRS